MVFDNARSFDNKPMKKVIIVLTALLFALHMQAQDKALLDQIKTINGKITSFEADLSNTLAKSDEKRVQNGTLHYVKPHEFAAQFNTGKYMIVNEKKIKMDIGIFHGTFRLKDGGNMQALANIFLYGFQGRAQDLANKNNYSLSTKTDGGFHVITATTTKKRLLGIGYKQVIYKYHTDSLLLKEIVLISYKGSVDTYTISNVKYNVAVDKNRFQF